MTKFGKMGRSALFAGALVLAPVAALAAGFFTNGVPPAGGSQYPTTIPLTGNETFPADTNLPSGLNPASEAISAGQLAGYVQGVAGGGGWRNALIGGDFGTNLWQRGTTSASITTSLLYGPDRWWGLSGTGTAFTIIKQTGASDITQGYLASARVQRTAAQSGVLPVCVGQVLTSANSARFQGQTAEFVFHALAGANFSAANSQVTATIAYGTGTNDTAANFSTGSWSGYTVASAQVITIGTTWGRYSAVAAIPATATQIGVKICYTPVGTAGANDWFEFTGAQLDVNPAAVALTGASGVAGQALSLERRPDWVEATLQYAYYWRINESATITPLAPCANSTTSLALCFLKFPTTMRVAPTMSYTTGFAANTTTAMTAVTACTSLATSTAVASTAANQNNVLVACGSSAGFGAAGTTSFLYSNNGSGVIQASAEL